MRGKVTKRQVDALRPGSRIAFLWDTEVPGFGVRITPGGVRAYVFQYERGGISRRMTIGRHGAPWTPDSARDEVVRLRGELVKGADPAEERRVGYRAPTVKEFAERFMSDHVTAKLKSTSVRSYRVILDSHVLPALGRKKLAAVTRSEVSRLHLTLRNSPYQANRTLATLSKMMNLAERWGLRMDGSNPCRHVERFPESKRERFLSEKELARLGTVLAEAEREETEPRFAISALRMLLLSGMRVGEVLSLKWEEVDLQGGFLNLADSKTGRKAVRIGAPARSLLAALEREEDNPFCFHGKSEGTHLVGLPHVWHRIRNKSGLAGVRLHDLRHSFASTAAIGGNSLIIIGALLGHREASTTARYAHLSDDPVRKAADSTSRAVAAALAGRKSRNPTRLRVRSGQRQGRVKTLEMAP